MPSWTGYPGRLRCGGKPEGRERAGAEVVPGGVDHSEVGADVQFGRLDEQCDHR